MLKNILDNYVCASGQIINFEKSSISFSRNVNRDMRERVGNIVGVRSERFSGNYLGLPSLVGRNKRDILGDIKNTSETLVGCKAGIINSSLKPEKKCC